MSPTFAALRVRNFALFSAGQVVSNTGTWMQRVAQDWLVLQLTHNSGTALGVTTAAQFAPLLALSLWGGVLADRYPKRWLLMGTQAAMGLQALALGLLVVTGHASVAAVYLLALGLGIAAAVDTPVRQSFVVEMVGPGELSNAVALNSATFNLGRVIGPALAGLLIAAVGTGAVFLINAASYLAVLAGLAAMRPADLRPTRPLARAKGQLRDTFAYLASRPDLLLALATVGLVGTIGFNTQVTTALMATGVFHLGAAAFGLLGAAFAVGGLAGALVAARRGGTGHGRPGLALVLVLAAAFGLLQAVSALAPTAVVFAALLVPTGVAALWFLTSANSSVQMGADAAVRGRVMAVYALVFLGGTPLGSVVVGHSAEVVGPRVTLAVSGVAVVAVAAALAVWAVRHDVLATSSQVPAASPRGSIDSGPARLPGSSGDHAHPHPSGLRPLPGAVGRRRRPAARRRGRVAGRPRAVLSRLAGRRRR